MSVTAPTTTHTVLRAEGFSCPSCVTKIEKQVGRIDGLSTITVHFASARIEIDHDPSVVSVDELIAAVAKAGYSSQVATF
jgi:copper chaperone